MFSNLPQQIAYTRKALIQICTLVITLGTAVLTYTTLPDKYAGLITAVVGIAGSVLHYATANGPAPGAEEADEDFDQVEAEADDAVDAANPAMQPAPLVTVDQVNSTVPPDQQPPAAPPTT